MSAEIIDLVTVTLPAKLRPALSYRELMALAGELRACREEARRLGGLTGADAANTLAQLAERVATLTTALDVAERETAPIPHLTLLREHVNELRSKVLRPRAV